MGMSAKNNSNPALVYTNLICVNTANAYSNTGFSWNVVVTAAGTEMTVQRNGQMYAKFKKLRFYCAILSKAIVELSVYVP